MFPIHEIIAFGVLPQTAHCKPSPAVATPGDAGDGGPATEASLNEPQGLCFYGDDILLISDHYNNRLKAVKVS